MCDKTIIGLLPCAGTASRLYNLPKYMLPLKNENGSLLSRWIQKLLEQKCSKIIIGVSFSTKPFVEHIIKYNVSNDIHDKICIKLVGDTQTMNETINKCISGEKYDIAIMCMPDTYVSNISYNLIEKLFDNNDIHVGGYLWSIRSTQIGKIGQCNIDEKYIIDIVDKDVTCTFKYGWGAVVFKPEFEKYMLDADLHTGYSMKRFLDNDNKIVYNIEHDQYFDCGTVAGYTEYLTTEYMSS